MAKHGLFLFLLALSLAGCNSVIRSEGTDPVSGTAPTAAAVSVQDSPTPGALLPGESENTRWLVNPSSGTKLFILVTYPADGGSDLLPAVVMVPGGLGAQDLSRSPGEDALRIAEAGFVVIQFDADGRGSSGGKENYDGNIHQDGLAALILAAGQIPRVDASRLGVISRSYGVTMASGALARYPSLPVRFYIDWEGPADRRDTTTGCTGKHGDIDWASCEDEAFWSEREAVNFIGSVSTPYQRIQSATDHVQRDNSHAVEMINAAVVGGVPWVRLNDDPPNRTYDPSNPPVMLPDSIDRTLPELFIRYALALLQLKV
jgi:hypothetical protein